MFYLYTSTVPPSEREVNLTILPEAFPMVEKELCKFELESHRGNIGAGTNALLEVLDLTVQPEPQAAVSLATETPPPLSLRQSPDILSQSAILLPITSASQQQLRVDEDYARTFAAIDEYR
ncbi:hypothetical protein BGZ99_006874, partial [Dissophora globulifera]